MDHYCNQQRLGVKRSGSKRQRAAPITNEPAALRRFSLTQSSGSRAAASAFLRSSAAFVPGLVLSDDSVPLRGEGWVGDMTPVDTATPKSTTIKRSRETTRYLFVSCVCVLPNGHAPPAPWPVGSFGSRRLGLFAPLPTPIRPPAPCPPPPEYPMACWELDCSALILSLLAAAA